MIAHCGGYGYGLSRALGLLCLMLASTRRCSPITFRPASGRISPTRYTPHREPTIFLFTAGAEDRERSDREPALAHSIYTDAKLEGGRITTLIVLGLGVLAAGYIARTKYKR